MLRRLLPYQDNFFRYFEQIADLLVTTAQSFNDLMHDLPNPKPHVDKILSYEEEGDHISYITFNQLHKTFITPFDRNDIHKLTSGLDDILDQFNRCAQRFPIYELKEIPNEIVSLAELTLFSSIAIKEAVYRLSSLKKADEIFKYCEEVNILESKAHKFVLAGEKNLFLQENDFKHFFKLKDIYSRTKLVINALQDVSNIIKGIILEYS